MQYYILTFGCQMNARESDTIAGLVEAMGYIQSDSVNEADLIIFNTCSVRHSAENKVYGKLGEINKLKKSEPDKIIAFGGCMAQLQEAQERIKKIGVDIVFGTHNVHELPYLIQERKENKKRIFRVWEQESNIIEELPFKKKPGISGFINIMYGCNNFCSYCIVPYTRGRERSRTPESIIEEIKQLCDQGYKEITLLGQNVNSYGIGLENDVVFADLLTMCSEIKDLNRIRFTTSHPKDISEKLIDVIAGHDKICEHIHAPLQAGSNRILKDMNRGYTKENYIEMVEMIRSKIPEAAISSDLIVGFPGESDDDFQETLDMINKVRFDAAFTFMYSIRSGTKAADMQEQIPLEVKKARLEQLNKLQYGIAIDLNQHYVGKTVKILVEGQSKNNPDKLTGRLKNNRIAVFFGNNDLIGKEINVKINKGNTFTLFGEIVST